MRLSLAVRQPRSLDQLYNGLENFAVFLQHLLIYCNSERLRFPHIRDITFIKNYCCFILRGFCGADFFPQPSFFNMSRDDVFGRSATRSSFCSFSGDVIPYKNPVFLVFYELRSSTPEFWMGITLCSHIPNPDRKTLIWVAKGSCLSSSRANKRLFGL
jgi:hypothetical protein